MTYFFTRNGAIIKGDIPIVGNSVKNQEFYPAIGVQN